MKYVIICIIPPSYKAAYFTKWAEPANSYWSTENPKKATKYDTIEEAGKVRNKLVDVCGDFARFYVINV